MSEEMRKNFIKKEIEDKGFRGKVTELMGFVKEEIVFVAGEGSILAYPELEKYLYELPEKGVRIKGYLSNPSRDVVEKLISAGCDIYLEKAVKNHFFVFDRENWLSTPYHQPGEKRGVLHMNDPEGGKHKLLFFEDLTWSALFLSYLMRKKEHAEADKAYPPSAYLSSEEKAQFMAEILPKVEEALNRNDWRKVKLLLRKWSKGCFWAFWETPVLGEGTNVAKDLDEVVYAL